MARPKMQVYFFQDSHTQGLHAASAGHDLRRDNNVPKVRRVRWSSLRFTHVFHPSDVARRGSSGAVLELSLYFSRMLRNYCLESHMFHFGVMVTALSIGNLR
jgi:hypothetical protein